MRILGIETSCDETAVALIEIKGAPASPQFRVHSNVVSSQTKLHALYGGVVPNLAKREHQANLVLVLKKAFKESIEALNTPKARGRESRKRIFDPGARQKTLAVILEREPNLLNQTLRHVVPMQPTDIDAIAVTVGPGLAPALWVGVNFARALAYLWGVPIIPVNHLEGHVYTNLLPAEWRSRRMAPLKKIAFPALCLIVSGGHTELVLMSGHGKYRIIGETLDDAAGEAFDKTAKMLGLGYPGGPLVSRLAERGSPDAIALPRPMIQSKNFDFSFSGLKTAVLYSLRDNQKISKEDMAASFEQAVVDVLVSKTVRAAKQYRAKTVLIGGGVAANQKLRIKLGMILSQECPNAECLMPDPSLTGDNALMIALAAYFNRKKKKAWRSIQADAGLRLAD